MKARYLVYLFCMAACLFLGCMSTYTYSEEVPETSFIRRVEVKKAKTGQGERITEIHVLTDTVSGIPASKEMKRFETEYEHTRQLRHRKWNWTNGKWVEEKITLPKSY